MILEIETFKKFGYYSNDLSPKSSKKIIVACDKCGKIREITKYNYRALCKSCIRKGKKNPNYGREFSKETKQKISDNHADFRGEKSSLYGKHPSKETREKMSDTWKERFKNPENHPWYGRHHSDISKEKISTSNKESGIFRGDLNPNWRGGTSFEPYCFKFNEEFKERVREYWNRKCVVCDKTELENGNRLNVHHVTYNKETCCDDSVPLFVALCNSCHTKTNFNIEYWEDEFKKIIYSKNINGKCYYTEAEWREFVKYED